MLSRNLVFAGSIPPPTYTSISPATGKTGDTVTISGTNFVAGNTTIHFGTTAATSVNVTSTSSLTCVVPDLGTSNTTSTIKITTPSGSVTSGVVFTYYAAPTISGFSNWLTANTSGNVNIGGTNFVNGQTSVSVNGSGRPVTFNSSTSLTVSMPSLARGGYSVVVSTPGGSATSTFYYVIIPTLTSINPSSMYVNVNYNITVTGTNFISGNVAGGGGGQIYTDGSGYPYKGATINSDTSLTFNNTYTSTGTFRVDVIGQDGWSNTGYVTISNIPAPSITSTSDGRGGNGSLTGSTITLSGSGFAPGVGTTSVSIGGTAVSATVSNTSISFTCPNLSTDGTKTISVTTSAGSTTSSVYFWAARSATTVVNATSGSGSYTPPLWANFLDVVVRGGGGGGGGGVATAWGGGGSAGAASGGTINLVSAGFGARSWSVGGGGPGSGSTTAGSAGGTSSAAGYSASGGAGGCSRCNGGAGAGGSAFTAGSATSPAPTGGGGGNSSQPGANPGSGGGGGNSALGPYPGITGRGGAVIMVVRQ